VRRSAARAQSAREIRRAGGADFCDSGGVFALPVPRSWAAVLSGALFLWVCSTHLGGPSREDLHAQDVRQQLQGTWLREGAAEGMRVHHVLELGADGAFAERVQMTDRAGRVREYTHAGTWLYDGTNLKRKYSLINGKPPSRLNLPFATFEISFPTRNEFVGVDHVYGNRIEYRRVGTSVN
jgi:hypothetical protein